jgi:hypothetical protein
VDNVGISVSGAKSLVVEAVKVYDNIQTLTSSGTSTGTTLSLATVNSDNASFASHAAAITARLGQTGDATFHLRTGVEVVSPSDLTLSNDWNLGTSRAAGEPGMLTLRAGVNLNISNNLRRI